MEKFSSTKSVSFSILHIVWEFQLDRTNNEEMGGKGGPQGVQIWLFSMFIFIIYSFIHLIHHYFPILLVCEEWLGIKL